MSEQKMIYGQLIKIMSDMTAIEKERKNTQGSGYMFRGIDDLYNTVHPLMAKHGVFMVPKVIERIREERVAKAGGSLIYTLLHVEYTYYATDGSSVSCIVTGEGFDSGDKSANKAMSGAQKYALLQTFCIPTKEDKDSENETHDILPRGNGNTEPTHYKIPFGKFAQKTLEEVGANELRNYVNYIEGKAKKDGKSLTGEVADFIKRAEAYVGDHENAMGELMGDFNSFK